MRFKLALIVAIAAVVWYLPKIYKKPTQLPNILGKSTKITDVKKPPSVFDPLIAESSAIAQTAGAQAQSYTGAVLGTATKKATELASAPAALVADYVFKQGVDTVLKQIDKLPEKQKDELKSQLCK